MKNWTWYVLAAAALAVAFLVQSPYMAYGLYAFLLLLLIAHLSSNAWLAGLDCERALSVATVQAGDEAEVTVTVTNKRGWPIPWIFLEDQSPAGFPCLGENKRLAILMPGRSLALKYRLVCTRRGYHRIGPLLMESGDLFGLQRRFRTGEKRDYVAVLPTIAYIDTFNIASKRPQGPVRISNRIYADPTRINSIREYAPGDPMNSIHWKASARTGKLHVKTYEPSSVTGGTIVLDLFEESFVPEHKDERIELAVTVAASLAYLLQMSGEQVGLLTNARDAAEVARFEAEGQQVVARSDAEDVLDDEDEGTRISPLSVPTRRSPIQAQKIIENLARVLPGSGLDAIRLILVEHSRLPRDAALLVISPHVHDALALALGSMKIAGFNVSVFIIKDHKNHEEAARLLAPHHIHAFHIQHERDLHNLSIDKIGA